MWGKRKGLAVGKIEQYAHQTLSDHDIAQALALLEQSTRQRCTALEAERQRGRAGVPRRIGAPKDGQGQRGGNRLVA